MLQQWPLVGREDELQLAEASVGLGQGLVIAGASGTGKSRLLDELQRRLRAAGRPVDRTAGSPALQAIPFGCLAPLLPLLRDTGEGLSAIQTALGALGGGDRVLLIDDAQWVDAMSAALLLQLAGTGEATIVTTIRSDLTPPHEVAALWKDGRAVRMDLQPLAQDEAHELLRDVLGGDLDPRTWGRLWQVSAGNPLYLRELVLAALGAGQLRVVADRWTIDGTTLPVPTRLAELVASRLETAPDELMPALDLLAAVGSWSLALLDAEFGEGATATLERLDLVTVTSDDQRWHVRLAHPAYDEYLRERIGPATARRWWTACADMIEARGARRREDLLRLATWRLDAGVPAEAPVLIEAARQARYAGDLGLARRLAEAVGGYPPDPSAQLVLGQVMDDLGDNDGAVAVLRPLLGDEQPDDVREAAALALSDVLFFGMSRGSEADAVLAAAEGLDGPLWADVVANRAWLAMHRGHVGDALRIVDELRARIDDDNVDARAAHAIVASMALAVAGRTERADRLLDEVAPLVEVREGDASRHDGFLEHSAFWVRVAAGDLAEALAMAEVACRRMETGARPFLRARWEDARGRALLFAGRMAEAAAAFRVAADLQVGLRQPGLERHARAGLIQVLVALGEIEEAERIGAELRPFVVTMEAGADPVIGRSLAWLAAGRGELSRARQFVQKGAELAGDDALLWVASAWHDLVRMGDPAAAAAPLARLAEAGDSALVVLFADHAAAAAAGDMTALVRVGDQFLARGGLLYAVDAFADASVAASRAGDPRGAARSRQRATTLAEQVGGLQTPAVARAGPGVVLTPREQEVLTLAAGGASNAEIAERLVVSVRTVENLLQRVYTKLGVRTRREAARVAGLADT